MRIALIEDKHVLTCVGKMRDGEPTYYIRNLLSYLYKDLDTPSVLRKLKDMEKRGLIARARSPYFKNNISWKVA